MSLKVLDPFLCRRPIELTFDLPSPFGGYVSHPRPGNGLENGKTYVQLDIPGGLLGHALPVVSECCVSAPGACLSGRGVAQSADVFSDWSCQVERGALGLILLTSPSCNRH